MSWKSTDLPRWFRVTNSVIEQGRRLGFRPPRVTLEELLEEAGRATGLVDFGARDFEQPIALLLDSVYECDALTTLGAKVFRQSVLRALCSRLRIEHARKAATLTPIVRPIFILGLPRTGTTLLQRMLASINGVRSPRVFELYRPIEERPGDERARIKKCQSELDLLYATSPYVRVIHDVEAESPDECHFILENSGVFPAAPPALRYQEWLATADVRWAYREHRTLLQLWQRDSAPTWVLKDPAHVFFLRALIDAYPDAAVVHCHRSVDACVSSLCSLIHGFRLPTTRACDPRAVGLEALQHCERSLQAALDARSWLTPAQQLDVEYDALVRDPVAVVRRIGEHFGFEWNDAHFAAAARYVLHHPKHKHGAHKHDLASYGLTHEQVHERLARLTTAAPIDGAASDS